jgi:ABC-2 type transport system ATP-binding protein
MIAIQDLSFNYKRREKLFSALNLNLSPGNIYGLLGKNGVGKTTMLKIISGLLFPQKGSCKVMGYESRERSPEFLKEIYFLPEEFYVPDITAKQYVHVHAPFYPKFDSKAFPMHLDEFGIPQNRRLSTLSYGQKKKFLLAFGLASGSSLLLMDEPTNGLDIPSKSQFRKLLASSISDERTFIVSTHQVRDMENLIDPVIILDEGKIVFNQSMENISGRLKMELQPGEPQDGNILFSERVPGGYSVVTENNEAEDSRIDLEILFNAVISNREKVNSIFRQEG